MKRIPENEFDAHARGLHAAALTRLSPQTLLRLRAAREQAGRASQRRPWPWLAATAFSMLLAVMIGVQWLPGPQAPTLAADAGNVANAGDTAATLLEENPDLYLWLASSEAQPMAME